MSACLLPVFLLHVVRIVSYRAHRGRRSPTWIFCDVSGSPLRFCFSINLSFSFSPPSSILLWLFYCFLHGVRYLVSLDPLLLPAAMLATETAPTPHLRVSAVKSTESKTDGPQQSSRVAPPPSIVEDQFFWTYTEEPHRSRRQAIIKAHPEVGSSWCPPVDSTGLWHFPFQTDFYSYLRPARLLGISCSCQLLTKLRFWNR